MIKANPEKESLSNEHQKAIKRFESLAESFSIENLPQNRSDIKLSDFQKDVSFFSRKLLLPKSLPHGDTWSWNRSVPVLKKQIKLKAGIGSASIFKLNSRRKHLKSPNPGAKVWIFHVYNDSIDSSEFLFSFFWCEFGLCDKLDAKQAEIVKGANRVKKIFAPLPVPIIRIPCPAVIVSDQSVSSPPTTINISDDKWFCNNDNPENSEIFPIDEKQSDITLPMSPCDYVIGDVKLDELFPGLQAILTKL